MTTEPTDAQREAAQRHAQQWLQSNQGRETMLKALQDARDVTARLQRERQVDLKSLHEPFTV